MKKYTNIIVFMFFFTSCAVMNTGINETAETLEPGNFKIASEAYYTPDYMSFLKTTRGDTVGYESYRNPVFGLKFRIGLKKNIDIGAVMWGDGNGTIGTKLNVKYRLPISDSLYSIALYPGIGFSKSTDDGLYNNTIFKATAIELPIITSYKFSKNFSIYNVVKYGYDRFDLQYYDNYVFENIFYLGVNNIHSLSVITGFSVEIWKLYWRPELGFIGKINSDGIYPIFPIMGAGVGWKQ